MSTVEHQAGDRCRSMAGQTTIAGQAGRDRASLRSKSKPRRRVASSTAYEMRKWVSRVENTLPGMIKRLFLIASATNSLPVPHGARGKA